MPHRIAGKGTNRLAPSLSALFDGWIAQRRAQAERIIAANGDQPPAPGDLARALDPPTDEAVARYYLWSYLWTTMP